MSLELAEACLQAGELAEALAALDDYLAGAPDDRAARRLRVDVLRRLPGRAREALAELDRLSGDEPLLRYEILTALGEEDAAFAVVEQAYRRSADLDTAELLLRLFYRRAEADAALRLLADLPQTWRWLGWGGDFYALKADCSGAAAAYSAALADLQRVPPSAIVATQRAHLLLKRADAFRRLKRWSEAETDLRAAAQLVPNDPTIPFNQGLVLYESGSLHRALPLCRDALDHAPETLRDHMRAVLTTEPRYRTLAQALLL